MFRVTHLRNLALLFASAATAFAAGDGPAVSPRAAPLFGDYVTNSMLTGWVVSVLLVLLVIKLIGKPSIVPSKGQAVIEALITSLRDLLEPIVGKKAFPTAFPLLITFFIF